MPIQIKRDPYLWAFAALLVVGTMALIWHHDVTFKEGAAFIGGALAMPALLGTKKKDDDDQPPGQTPVLVDERTSNTLPVPREPSVMPYRTLAARFVEPTPSALVMCAGVGAGGGGGPRPWSSAWSMRGAILVASTVGLLWGCAAITPQQKAAAADSTYAADMLKCVDDATTLAESRACRTKVREQWHVDAGSAQ